MSELTDREVKKWERGNESNEKAKRTCGGCKKDEEEFLLPIPKNKKNNKSVNTMLSLSTRFN